MCGIIGWLSTRGKISDVHTVDSGIARALESLKHRGPCESGRWISPDAGVALANARLSIIDLETGRQPICNEDADIYIVVNGEFYGYEQQRRELIHRGHRFRTGSDSEIALHLYEEHGAECLRHLRGEFALIIWDLRKKTLFAARDRFGIKPLFYALHNDRLCLASEVKALFALGIPAAWNWKGLFHTLSAFYLQKESLFRDVCRIPPGHYLKASGERVDMYSYWDFNYPEEKGEYKKDEEYLEEFKHTFTEAVKIRLRADVPVGCYLSGGIDSSAIAGFAGRMLDRPLNTFCIEFADGDYNEEPIARDTAAYTGSNFSALTVTDADIAEHYNEAVRHGETLFGGGTAWQSSC